jgi:hypothetical protein
MKFLLVRHLATLADVCYERASLLSSIGEFISEPIKGKSHFIKNKHKPIEKEK